MKYRLEKPTMKIRNEISNPIKSWNEKEPAVDGMVFSHVATAATGWVVPTKVMW